MPVPRYRAQTAYVVLKKAPANPISVHMIAPAIGTADEAIVLKPLELLI
jgi:hypothetical protein